MGTFEKQAPGEANLSLFHQQYSITEKLSAGFRALIILYNVLTLQLFGVISMIYD